MKNVIPQFGDDDKTVKSKMDRIRKDLSEKLKMEVLSVIGLVVATQLVKKYVT